MALKVEQLKTYVVNYPIFFKTVIALLLVTLATPVFGTTESSYIDGQHSFSVVESSTPETPLAPRNVRISINGYPYPRLNATVNLLSNVTCTADGAEPINYYWTDHMDSTTNQRTITLSHPGQGLLYTCQAFNSAGSSQQVYYFTVHEETTEKPGKGGLGAGAIVGIVIGVIAGIAAIIGCCCICNNIRADIDCCDTDCCIFNNCCTTCTAFGCMEYNSNGPGGSGNPKTTTTTTTTTTTK